MISQRKCGQVIRLPPIVRKINRKITLVFHYFARIEKIQVNYFAQVIQKILIKQ